MTDADKARDVLSEILKRMGFEAQVELRAEAERDVLDVKGPDGALVIGKKGATLDSLQYLVGKIVHKGEERPSEAAAPEAGRPARRTILVDAEGYRERREAALVEMAHRLAEKVRQTKRGVMVDPMSPHDRRVIHLALDKVPGVTTRSEGEGIYRRLQIVPAPDKA